MNSQRASWTTPLAVALAGIVVFGVGVAVGNNFGPAQAEIVKPPPGFLASCHQGFARVGQITKNPGSSYECVSNVLKCTPLHKHQLVSNSPKYSGGRFRYNCIVPIAPPN